MRRTHPLGIAALIVAAAVTIQAQQDPPRREGFRFRAGVAEVAVPCHGASVVVPAGADRVDDDA